MSAIPDLIVPILVTLNVLPHHLLHCLNLTAHGVHWV